MLETLREDYIRTARSKGLNERVVLIRHALRNAALPIVTVIGLGFAALLSGLVRYGERVRGPRSGAVAAERYSSQRLPDHSGNHFADFGRVRADKLGY